MINRFYVLYIELKEILMNEVNNMKISESALETEMNYRSFKRNNTINKISQRLNNKILAELRIKAAEIYNKLYIIRNNNGPTLYEVYYDIEFDYIEMPEIETYIELIMESKIIEDQITSIHNNSLKKYNPYI